VNIEDLLLVERVRQGVKYPVLLRTGHYTWIDREEYEWVHKLIDVKDDKPIYTTGLILAIDEEGRS